MKFRQSSKALNLSCKSLIYGLCIFFFSACEEIPEMTVEQQSTALTFNRVESILKEDDGEFWNYPLYGPILLVDPETRIFIANQNDQNQSFTPVEDIYTDTLPESINIANTAIEWNNERWTMVRLPLPEEEKKQNNLVIHELFHRIQPAIGFDGLRELNNGHLDVFEGRMLLILELEALRDALMTEEKTMRKQHLINAFTFRNQRHTTADQKAAENMLELNEGLAEYTGMMLSDRSAEELKQHFNLRIDRSFSNPTFTRSFAYETTPIYGYLRNLEQANWHKSITKETNLTDYFLEAFAIQIEENIDYKKLAEQYDYNYEKHLEREKKRESERLAEMAVLRQKFTKNPTLRIPFQNMNMSFDERNVVSLQSLGAIYPTIRVTDNWGILTVENGALIDPNWSSIMVTPPKDQEASIIRGDGWKLELKEDWEVVKKEEQFELRKKVS